MGVTERRSLTVGVVALALSFSGSSPEKLGERRPAFRGRSARRRVALRTLLPWEREFLSVRSLHTQPKVEPEIDPATFGAFLTLPAQRRHDVAKRGELSLSVGE